MSFYDDAATAALQGLTRYGATFAIRRVGKDYDPATGEAVELVKLSGTLTGMLLRVQSAAAGIFKAKADNRLVEDLIGGKLRLVLAAAKGAPFEPEPNDLMELNGELYTVKGSTPLSPAGTPLLYYIAVEWTPAAPTNADTLELPEVEDAAGEFNELVNESLPANL